MDALWRTGAATVALVAEDAGAIVGQVAFSKVKVGGADVGWHGCGPLSVLPGALQARRRRRPHAGGTGAVARARRKGCVLVGDPKYYSSLRF